MGTSITQRTRVRIHYHECRGGAGLIPLWLDELPEWLEKRPNTMVDVITVLFYGDAVHTIVA